MEHNKTASDMMGTGKRDRIGSHHWVHSLTRHYEIWSNDPCPLINPSDEGPSCAVLYYLRMEDP